MNRPDLETTSLAGHMAGHLADTFGTGRCSVNPLCPTTGGVGPRGGKALS